MQSCLCLPRLAVFFLGYDIILTAIQYSVISATQLFGLQLFINTFTKSIDFSFLNDNLQLNIFSESLTSHKSSPIFDSLLIIAHRFLTSRPILDMLANIAILVLRRRRRYVHIFNRHMTVTLNTNVIIDQQPFKLGTTMDGIYNASGLLTLPYLPTANHNNRHS
jgi:hypothetical protein